MARIEKARFWTGVLYPENMKQGWQEQVGDIVQLPYVYCAHTRDRDAKSEHRKDHVHMILGFSNTTTYNHALSVFELLSADGKKSVNKIEAVVNIRSMYDYLLHDTETCRKVGKEQYSPEERISGNNFDIGAYEQISLSDKRAMCKELAEVIIQCGFTNFSEFYNHVISHYEDTNYFEVVITYSGFFERLTRGNYQIRFSAENGLNKP